MPVEGLIGEQSVSNKRQQHRRDSLVEVARSDPGFLEWMLSIDVPADTKELVRRAEPRAELVRLAAADSVLAAHCRTCRTCEGMDWLLDDV